MDAVEPPAWRGAYSYLAQGGSREHFTAVAFRGVQFRVEGLPSARAAAALADVVALWSGLVEARAAGGGRPGAPALNFPLPFYRPLLLSINACTSPDALLGFLCHLRDSAILSLLAASVEFEEARQRQLAAVRAPAGIAAAQQHAPPHAVPPRLAGHAATASSQRSDSSSASLVPGMLSGAVPAVPAPPLQPHLPQLPPRLMELGRQLAAQAQAAAAAVPGGQPHLLPMPSLAHAAGQPGHPHISRLPSQLSVSQAPQPTAAAPVPATQVAAHGRPPHMPAVLEQEQQALPQAWQQAHLLAHAHAHHASVRHRLCRSSSDQENASAALALEQLAAAPLTHQQQQLRQQARSSTARMRAAPLSPLALPPPHQVATQEAGKPPRTVHRLLRKKPRLEQQQQQQGQRLAPTGGQPPVQPAQVPFRVLQPLLPSSANQQRSSAAWQAPAAKHPTPAALPSAEEAAVVLAAIHTSPPPALALRKLGPAASGAVSVQPQLQALQPDENAAAAAGDGRELEREPTIAGLQQQLVIEQRLRIAAEAAARQAGAAAAALRVELQQAQQQLAQARQGLSYLLSQAAAHSDHSRPAV